MRLASSGMLFHYTKRFEWYGLLESVDPLNRSTFLKQIPHQVDFTVKTAQRSLMFSDIAPVLIFLVLSLALSAVLLGFEAFRCVRKNLVISAQHLPQAIIEACRMCNVDL